ncbi:substrate-binding domain-containing protein [Marinobacter salicampi]|uniref:substrate-binding domain-containing protein n=1 Tax=Marinobacter salicampi TaxID=435907 RepID=UPI001407EEB7|nr:substrate-binding domain-containing protein [Marinobacter salicampi]
MTAKRSALFPALLLALAGLSPVAAAQPGELPETIKRPELRVCSDPNNLPFSNRAGEGFENQLAELVADELGKEVRYEWHAQRRGFLRNTLNAGKCDIVMGTPHLGMLATTRSYYNSTYVFLSRADRNLTFSSMKAPELQDLTIGVHLIGDDGANTPPAHALGEQGIVDNVEGFMIYGDYREDSPPSRLVKAVARDEIDVAAVWGPLAGYYAARSAVPLRLVPITDTLDYMPMLFQYPIAMGVRKTDPFLKNQLNEFIYQNGEEIQALLERYNIPLAGRMEPVILGGGPG